jgi:hypothetical protein
VGIVNDSTQSRDTDVYPRNAGAALAAAKWCVDQLLFNEYPKCDRCGHGDHFHRLDDATNVSPTDPEAKFRCIWPLPEGPPVQLCDCPDYLASVNQ